MSRKKEFSPPRYIFLTGSIDREEAELIVEKLIYLEKKSSEDIVIYINSPGGTVTCGIAICDMMKVIRPRVITICTGEASSMATAVLASGDPGYRYATLNSRIMVHQASSHDFSGTVADFIVEQKELAKLNSIVLDLTSRGNKKLALRLARETKDANKDLYLSAKEAVQYGIIDAILPSRKGD